MLKKRYAIIWFLLSIITCNISILFLGKLLNVYDKNAWYTKWYYWVLGLICGIFPAIIMLFILVLETNVKIAKRFDVAGAEIYSYPYIWIGAIIIPIIGWAIFIILALYLYVWYIIGLFKGKGEKCLK